MITTSNKLRIKAKKLYIKIKKKRKRMLNIQHKWH